MRVEPRALNRAEQSFVRWHLRVPTDVQPSDITSPTFWAPASEMLRVGDVVRVTRADNAFDLELVVTARIAGNLRVERFPKEAVV